MDGQASLAPCSNAAKLTYTWKDRNGALTSISSDPRYLKLAPYTLSPNSIHNLTVWVKDNNGDHNHANATVIVLPSTYIVAKIHGGDQTVGTGLLQLDASGSYDPDLSTSRNKGITYSWSCMFGGINYGNDCGLVINSTSRPIVNISSAGESLSPRSDLSEQPKWRLLKALPEHGYGNENHLGPPFPPSNPLSGTWIFTVTVSKAGLRRP